MSSQELPTKQRIRAALDVLANYVDKYGKIDAMKMTQEIKQLCAENERLRELVEGKGCDPDIVLRNKMDAERWRKVRPQLYVYYNDGTGHWQLCMVAGGISGTVDYVPTVEQALDEVLKDGS